ncbi:uncharacterized protein EI90DRAFT_3043238 [Cantharellus anzutake]|uniref:uncharacterized protein n=1 Tax=Cantharellus anzutake TaxID=1750568 RepID=UPI001906F514|nr:uncharacterized protein EI90DRAFT_3043238 [Cantharellus anzutake]KAF8337518.1 hypothetical protein EI90DRAFT_3043238 [Cantharellus anzutake]
MLHRLVAPWVLWPAPRTLSLYHCSPKALTIQLPEFEAFVIGFTYLGSSPSYSHRLVFWSFLCMRAAFWMAQTYDLCLSYLFLRISLETKSSTVFAYLLARSESLTRSLTCFCGLKILDRYSSKHQLIYSLLECIASFS